MAETGFLVGDRVSRPVDVFDARSAIRHGVITRRYGKRSFFGWFDPELYAVKFDDGAAEEGFFRHGLDRIAEAGR